jgi:DNA-binding transcriptional MerR regulator
MMIGELGNRTGTKVNTIRYYEDIGILPPPVRTDSGRRTYAECDVKRLSFIRHSRSFGFSLAEIRSLLSLSDSPEQDCTLASTIAKSHLERIDMKISQL